MIDYGMVHEELKEFDGAWEDAPVETGSDNIPDGVYQARVERVEVKKSKTSGNLMLEWELVITHGEYEGRHVWKYNLLTDADKLRWTKKDLVTAGLKLNKLSELPMHLDNLLDRVLEIRTKTQKSRNGGDDFQAVYFNKLLVDPHSGEKAASYEFDEAPF